MVGTKSNTDFSIDKCGAAERAITALHVIPSVAPRYGGPSQAVYTTCRSLMAKNFQGLIATTNADGEGVLDVSLGELTEYQDVQTIFFHRQWSEALKYSRPFAKWLDRNVFLFDLVHIHAVFSHSCISAANACRKHGIPYIVRPLGTLDPWSLRQKRFRKKLFWHLGVKQMLSGAEAMHYTTTEEKRLAETMLGLGNGVVIPNGLDFGFVGQQFPPLAELWPAISAYPYMLALSRVHPKKGFELLIEAMRVLRDRQLLGEWRLVIAGDGKPGYVSQLKQLVRACDLDMRIYFVGWLSGQQKYAVLKEASLMVMPSYQENFGNSLIEGMAFGTPVLVSEHVNLAPEIEEAASGWVSELSVPALTEKLAEALTNNEELRRRGERGRILARNYEAGNVAEQLINLYHSITKARKRY